VSTGDLHLLGTVVVTLAAGVFLLLGSFGIRLPVRWQWIIAISLMTVMLWLLSRLADTVSV
jgi:hypothetical protein